MIAKANAVAKTIRDSSSGPRSLMIEDLDDERMAKNALVSWLDPMTGARQWFARLEVSGLFARRFGPFTTREQAVEFFHEELCRHIVNLCIEKSSGGSDPDCFLEDGIATAYLQRDEEIERKGA